MSKPRLRKADKRSEKLQVRFTPNEWRRVLETAHKAGKTYVSDWMREIVLKAVDTCTPDC